MMTAPDPADWRCDHYPPGPHGCGGGEWQHGCITCGKQTRQRETTTEREEREAGFRIPGPDFAPATMPCSTKLQGV